MPPNIEVLISLATIVFAAGGAWFALRESRRNVNGLGKNVRDQERQNSADHVRMALVLMYLAKDDAERRQVIEILLGGLR